MHRSVNKKSLLQEGEGNGWVTFFMDESEESEEAYSFLRNSHVPFITFRVAGSFAPVLKTADRSYIGLGEIRNLVESLAA